MYFSVFVSPRLNKYFYIVKYKPRVHFLSYSRIFFPQELNFQSYGQSEFSAIKLLNCCRINKNLLEHLLRICTEGIVS